ncbi:PREDICTED: uncharacterized protein LOC105567804 [Vollenhovia emeryi]|uniref:uncharacterized protein LOC105567804 n=1 Tax=Vollenhovia emeryi TaxID=411798 RepID=UPI0005F3D521|nr:PREDICTED: uncharacterized protein LOC105567804 [Vollenhovia emeryi]XP_011878391.1 PREDICTED: uncharacterized protein LOC105567804 [Vollenhovia emeryi]
MLVRALSIFGVTIFGLFSAAESNLPITTCKRDVVDYSACLKRALKEAWPRFSKGLPEYDFPSLDPLFYKYGKYILSSGEVRGKLVLLNVTCIGLSHIHSSDIRTHYNDDVFRLEIDGQVPYLRIEGTYRINGSLSVFKLVTQGHFNITAHDIRATGELTGHLVNDTWIVEHFHAIPSIGKMKFYADNLIESSKQLTVTTCKRNVVDYSTCLKRALEEAWPRLSKGLPEYDLPPLDPLFYNYGKAVFNSGALRGDIRFFNLTCIGLSQSHFSDIRAYYTDEVFHVEIDIQVPRIFVEGIVKVNGSLNVFKLVSEGYTNVTAVDVTGTWNLTGHVVNNTWIVEHFRVAPSMRKLTVYADNLIEGSKELSDVIITFVNEYWPSIYRAMLPFMIDLWDPWLTRYPNAFFSKVPFSEVFP